MSAHAAVLEALIARGITGQGRRLEVSLFGALADWMNVPLLYYEGTGKAPQRVGLAHPSICPYGAFPTRDDGLVLIAIQNEREWAVFCAEVLGEPELAMRPGFDSNTARVAQRPAVDARVAEGLAAMTGEEARARLAQAGIAFGFVNGVADIGAHPALRRSPVQTPSGTASIVAPAAIHDGVTALLGPVPAIGAQSTAIRAEFASSSSLAQPGTAD
jgi:crotonobetainyl-CoA:carnitine CoA-transferase CaiB-like acyl-CoA transferase